MTRNRIIAAVVVALTCYFFVVPGLWTWLPPSATAVIPASWPHNKDMPLEIRVWTWHSNYEVREVRFAILPERGRVQANSPPLYPLVLLEGQHNRTWNRLTLNRFTFPRVRRISVVVPFERLAAEGRVVPGTREGFLSIRLDYVGSVNRYSSVPGADEVSAGGGGRQDFRIELE